MHRVAGRGAGQTELGETAGRSFPGRPRPPPEPALWRRNPPVRGGRPSNGGFHAKLRVSGLP